MRAGKRTVWGILFACYGVVMLILLFDRGGSTDAPYWVQIRDNLNLIPFYTIGNYWDILVRPAYYTAKWGAMEYAAQLRHAIINLGGNVGMFLPLGFFLPGVFEPLRRWWKTGLCALSVMTVVEVLQLFSLRGSCDVDDLLLNVLGAWMGYGIWKIFNRKRKEVQT